MSRKVRKAVFPVAGLGTRFLPATKAMPKELLPIVDRPLIQYAADEAVAAGIDTLIFITGRNKRAIEDHFDNNIELETILRRRGNEKQADMIKHILPENVECIFVRQSSQLGLGHAVLCAERAIGEEPFAVLLADDFIVNSKNGETKNLVTKYMQSGKSQISVMEVPKENVSDYGIVVQDRKKNIVTGIIEKPSLESAPSRIASIGRYVLTPDIFDKIRSLEYKVNEEIQLSDAINIQAKLGSVESVYVDGIRFDCGSIKGYLSAIKHVAEKRFFSDKQF